VILVGFYYEKYFQIAFFIAANKFLLLDELQKESGWWKPSAYKPKPGLHS
jgi:hypothetical protein